MNILILTSHLNIGGIPRYVINLAKFLKRKGDNVYVGSRGGFWEEVLLKEGLELLRLPLNTKSILSPKIIRAFSLIGEFLRTHKIDIIHANTRVTQFLAYLVYKKKKIPYISTFHGCYRPHIFRRLFKFEGLKAIAISNYVGRHLVEKLKIDKGKIRLIYNGIDIKDYQDKDVECWVNKLKEKIKGYPLLGVVSRLTPEKNIASLIRMMPLLLEEFPQAKLVILGEGRQELYLRKLVKELNLDKRVFFLKKIPSLAVFRILDIFVSLSRGEPFGLSVIEAQLAGLVSIVCNSGAFPEIVEDKFNGIILEKESPQALIEAINLVLKNPKFREELIRNAQRKIIELFSIEIMGKNTYNLYKEVLSK